MFESPEKQWRSLTALYADKYDEELWELAADYKDLTEMAQQVLRDEMKKRGIGDPTAPRPERSTVELPAQTVSVVTPTAPAPPPAVNEAERLRLARQYATLGEDDLRELAADYGNLTLAAQRALREEMLSRGMEVLQPDEKDESETLEEAESNPYFQAADQHARSVDSNSWWVRVAGFDDRETTRQRTMMLSDAGIEAQARIDPFGGYAIEVAADQAEGATAILEQPIPQRIIDESKIEVPEFELPKCPRCKAEDAVLDSTEGGNHWRCDACGHEWDEVVAEPGTA